MFSHEELVKEISSKSGKGRKEVEKLIKEKQAELSGLVSEEGAAYIVGRELGVDLIKETQRKLKIKNILSDMRNVEVVAKVMNVSSPREFDKNGKKGTVAGMILGDETGTIRLPLWNDEIHVVNAHGIGQDDVVEVTGAWAKSDGRNGVELRLGKRGKIKKVQDAGLKELTAYSGSRAEGPRQAGSRMSISMLSSGMTASVLALIVQAYKRKPYFDVCPTCGTKVEETGDKWVCKEHGNVEPKASVLLSAVIDDGTGNMRAVFFRESAEKIYGKNAAEVRAEFMKSGLDKFWEKNDVTGKEFIIDGRVKTNDFSQEMEMMVNSVKDVDAKAECEGLLKTLSG